MADLTISALWVGVGCEWVATHRPEGRAQVGCELLSPTGEHTHQRTHRHPQNHHPKPTPETTHLHEVHR